MASTKTAEELLAMREPEQLFTRDEDENKALYRRLASEWHPDKGGRADVFAHVKYLYEQAEVKLKAGTWHVPGLFEFRDRDGKAYEFAYRKRHKLGVGDMYVGNTLVAFSVEDTFRDLYENGVRSIKSLRYADANMAKMSKPSMPTIYKDIRTADRSVLLVQKSSSMLCLRDVLDHYGGKIDPKHVAWITSRMWGIATYLTYGAKLAHYDIAPESIFIDPAEHTAALLGGWWFAAPIGGPVRALSARSADLIAAGGVRPRASAAGTGDLLRATARELLGDLHGSRLLADKAIPQAMLMFLRSASNEHTYDEFKVWSDVVLQKSFGPRKFHKMELTAEQVYEGKT